jgi:hypothetical protein
MAGRHRGPEPAPATIDIGDTTVTVHVHAREGDGTADHNRTPSYALTTDTGDLGVVWRLNRGETPHYNTPHNEHVYDYDALIWFCRGTDGLEHGPYPGIVEAVTALLEAA